MFASTYAFSTTVYLDVATAQLIRPTSCSNPKWADALDILEDTIRELVLRAVLNGERRPYGIMPYEVEVTIVEKLFKPTEYTAELHI